MTPADIALIEAVHTDNVEAVRNAIAIGANVNVPDPRPLVGARNTPLHDAANRGNSDVVALLLANGADINARCDQGWTPLMRACNAGHLDVATLLLGAGADPSLANLEGYTAYDRVPGDCPELLALMKRHAVAADAG